MLKQAASSTLARFTGPSPQLQSLLSWHQVAADSGVGRGVRGWAPSNKWCPMPSQVTL